MKFYTVIDGTKPVAGLGPVVVIQSFPCIYMSTPSNPAATPKELLAQLQALVLEAEAMMAESAVEASAEAVGNLRDRIDAAQERLADLYADVKKKVVAGATYADTTVRENPYQAIMIAAAAGLVVGVCLGRRSVR